MGCQCYQIGGPFISFDPDCPAHVLEAQAREREQEAEQMKQAQREARMEQRIVELGRTVAQLRAEMAAFQRGE